MRLSYGIAALERKVRQIAFITAVSPSDVTNANRGHLCGQAELLAQFVIKVLLKRNLVGCLDFKGLFGEPGAGLVKPLHCGYELIGLFIVRQKLNLQSQFSGTRVQDKGALRQGNYRLEDLTMPNSSPPKLEDSLWVENPLAEMLNLCDWRRDIFISGAPLSLTIKAPSKLCSNARTHRRLMMRLRPARKKVVGFKRPTR